MVFGARGHWLTFHLVLLMAPRYTLGPLPMFKEDLPRMGRPKRGELFDTASDLLDAQLHLEKAWMAVLGQGDDMTVDQHVAEAAGLVKKVQLRQNRIMARPDHLKV